MFEGAIEVVEEGLVGGYEDGDVAVGSEELVAVGDGLAVVEDMLDDIERKHAVEGAEQVCVLLVEVGVYDIEVYDSSVVAIKLFGEGIAVVGADVAHGDVGSFGDEKLRDIADAASDFEDTTMQMRADGIEHPFVEPVGFGNGIEGNEAFLINFFIDKLTHGLVLLMSVTVAIKGFVGFPKTAKVNITFL